jgi:hypothetical protein
MLTGGSFMRLHRSTGEKHEKMPEARPAEITSLSSHVRAGRHSAAPCPIGSRTILGGCDTIFRSGLDVHSVGAGEAPGGHF